MVHKHTQGIHAQLHETASWQTTGRENLAGDRRKISTCCLWSKIKVGVTEQPKLNNVRSEKQFSSWDNCFRFLILQGMISNKAVVFVGPGCTWEDAGKEVVWLSCPGAPGQVESAGEWEMLLRAAEHIRMGKSPEIRERPGKEELGGAWEIPAGSRGPAQIKEQTQDQASEMMARTRLSWKPRWNCLEGAQAGKPLEVTGWKRARKVCPFIRRVLF